jgi:hypothetical protein
MVSPYSELAWPDVAGYLEPAEAFYPGRMKSLPRRLRAAPCPRVVLGEPCRLGHEEIQPLMNNFPHRGKAQ